MPIIREPQLDPLLADRARSVLWAILDQSTDCVKLLGIDGELEYMSANGRAAMEVDDFAILSGSSLFDFWPAESVGRLRLAVERAASGRKDRFEGFCPTAKGNDRWWDVTVSPISKNGEVTHILCSSRDITDRHLRAEERERRILSDRHAEREHLLAEELAHKMRNMVAVSTALARLTLRGDQTLQEGAERLVERFRNLGHAINALSGDVASQTLRGVVRAILGDGNGEGRISIGAVPDVCLKESDLRTIALVLGELHSNALKYGALSSDEGSLVVVFDHIGDGVRMRWKESGMSGVTEPAQLGTGSRLISRMTLDQPQAGTFDWQEDGLFFQLVFAAQPVPAVASSR